MKDLFPDPSAVPLRDYALDDVYDDLVRDASGTAVMSVRGPGQQIDVALGPHYRAIVVFAPKPAGVRGGVGSRGGPFVCLEPMAAISNAMNLAQRGLYRDLQAHSSGRHLAGELSNPTERFPGRLAFRGIHK